MSPLPPVGNLSDGESEPSIRLQEWTSFLTSYAEGDWLPDATPPMPCYVQESDANDLNRRPSFDDRPDNTETEIMPNIYTSPIINRKIAKNVRQYCSQNDYLPPPRSPDELLREKIILEYDLLGAVQAGNIQSAVEVMNAFFPGTVVTFTLFNNAIQNFVAVTGPPTLLETFGLKNGMLVAPETSMCGHSILLDGEILYVPSLEDDWRFRSNPYAKAGLKTYIGCPVSLELDPLNTTPKLDGRPERVRIGSLNILFMFSPLEGMSAQQEMVIRNITRMLETQLRATWEGHVRTREARVRRAITELIEEGFVGPQGTSLEISEGRTDASNNGVISGGATTMLEDLAYSALAKLASLDSNIDALCMIDIRSIRMKFAQRSRPEYYIDPSSPHPISTIAVAPQDGVLWNLPPRPSAMLSYLNQPHSLFTFSQSSPSGMESELPSSTKSHLIMPFFTVDQPSFVIIAVSASDAIEQASVNIIRSMGSVLLAKAMQSRVMEADAAKTAFLSSISHELRTPMHSIMSGLSLAHSSIEEEDWDNVRSLINVVESSGQALHRILDDVLDFDPAYYRKNKMSRSVTVDLLKLAQEAVHMCLTKSDDLELDSTVHLEYEERNWSAKVDEARYHRIIINGLTNAMKFCKNGAISVSLSTSDNSTKLITRITDSGIGIDESVLPRLLEPFTKQDLHSPGAGLGLYITKNLINSMGGTFAIRSSLGKGTIFEAILPIQFDTTRPSIKRSSSVRRVIQYKAAASRSGFLGLTTPNINIVSSDVNGTAMESPPLPDGMAKSRKTPSTNDPNALKVMVVDDNRICRLLLLKSIQKGPTPVQCAQAADGKQAIEVFTTFQPDLVITDVSMPVMDGITAAQRMRSISQEMDIPPCKIYALTGLGSSDPRLKSIGMDGSAALDGWLVKGQDNLKLIQGILSDVNEGVQRRKGIPEELLKKLKIVDETSLPLLPN